MKTVSLKRYIIIIMLFACKSAFAHDFEVDGIYYGISIFNKNTAYVTHSGKNYNDAKEYSGSVVIPEKVSYNGKTYPVASIGGYAFAGCDELTSVTIPSSVKTINQNAFSGCTGLQAVECKSATPPVCKENVFNNVNTQNVQLIVPNASKSAYKAADTWKNLNYGVSIGDTKEVEGINYKVISESAVEVIAGATKYTGNIVIPNDVTIEGSKYTVARIANEAFSGCFGMTSVTIPSTVTIIGDLAFSSCTGLTSVTSLNPTPPTCGTDVFGGVNIQDIPLTVPTGSVELYKAADVWKNFKYLILIGDTIENYGFTYRVISETAVEVIAGKVKYEGDIIIPSEVIIEDNRYVVTRIGNNAFYECTGLKSIVLLNTISSIGNTAFYGCTGLTSVTSLNSTPPTCETDVFGGVNTQNIPLTVTAESVSLYKAADTWKNFMFTVSIGETKEDGGLVYRVISGTAVEVIAGTTKYTGNITIPSEATIFGHKYNVIQIGADAFNGCTDLTSVIIPSTVTSIGNTAFYGCTDLTSVTSQNPTPPVCGTDVFGGVDTQNIPLTVPAESLSLYKTSDTWKNFKFPISIGETKEVGGLMYKVISESAVEVIAGATKYTGNITISSEVTIFGNKYNVTQIGADAFNSCTGLTSVIIPTTVTSIGNTAFYGCTGLTSVTSQNPTPPTCGTTVFGRVDTQNIPLTVPDESISLYRAADTWKDFGTIKGVNGGTEIPSEPTLEEVWVHDMSTVSNAVRNIACVSGNEIAATNMAFNGGADNVIFFNANGQTSKTHDVSKFLSDNNIGTTNDTGEFTPYCLGRGIDIDGAGNIVVNLDFPNPTSATNFVAIAPDGTMKHIECEVPSPGVAARADFFGVTGNVFENAYIGFTPSYSTYAVIYKIFEGEQDTDYSYLVNADEGSSFTNETKVFWAKKTFLEDAENAPEFYVYNRSLSLVGIRYSDGTKETAMVNMANKNENFSQGKASNSGATAFEVNGTTYIVMPTQTESGTRENAFKIVNVATGEIVVETQGNLNFGTNYSQDFSAYVNEDGTVSIAQLVMGKYLAMYKFYPGKKAMISYGTNVSGVETIEASDDEAEVEYYNLQGVRVYNPEKGIYIKKQGVKTTKVVL